MGLILVRSTVFLPGAPVGWVGLADEDDPYVARALRGRYFVRAGPIAREDRIDEEEKSDGEAETA